MAFSKLSWMKRLRGVKMPHARYRVLMTVFDYTSKDGTRAHPGTTRIAADSGIDRRDVQRHLRDLEQDGWLIVQHPGGNQHFKGAAKMYGLGNGPAPRDSQRETMLDDTKGGDSDTKGGDSLHGRAGVVPIPSDQSPDHLHHSARTLAASLPEATKQDAPLEPPEGWGELIFEYEALEEWLENCGLDATMDHHSSSTALGMWEARRHPKAIYNTLLKMQS